MECADILPLARLGLLQKIESEIMDVVQDRNCTKEYREGYIDGLNIAKRFIQEVGQNR